MPNFIMTTNKPLRLGGCPLDPSATVPLWSDTATVDQRAGWQVPPFVQVPSQMRGLINSPPHVPSSELGLHERLHHACNCLCRPFVEMHLRVDAHGGPGDQESGKHGRELDTGLWLRVLRAPSQRTLSTSSFRPFEALMSFQLVPKT